MNKPVAWVTQKALDDLRIPLISEITLRIAVKSKNTDPFNIPLYTHPAKHLSLQKVDGELVAVTYTDDEHRIVEVLWERPPAKTLTDEESAGIGLHLFRIGEAISIKDGIRLVRLMEGLMNIKKASEK